MNPLCDTNVLSELVRPQPNPGVLAWATRVSIITLSVIIVEEIHYGLSWRPNSRIQTWIEQFIDRQCEILPITAAIARHAGALRGQLQATGQVRIQPDMLIAATAVVHGRVLVTRNERDFQGCGVAILNPFA